MSLFNAPAWMMKGGGAGPAELAGMSDSDPFKDKTKVNLDMSNVSLNISRDKKTFILRFTINQAGFTTNAANVEFRLELRTAKKWQYTTVLNTVNMQQTGKKWTFDLSKQINGNGAIKQLLTDDGFHNVDKKGNGNCYLLFNTNTEICSDQIKCKISTAQ